MMEWTLIFYKEKCIYLILILIWMGFLLVMAHKRVTLFVYKKWIFSFDSSQGYMKYFQEFKLVYMDRKLLLQTTNNFLSNTRNNKITQIAEVKKIAAVISNKSNKFECVEMHTFESRIDMDGIYSKHVQEIGIDHNYIKTLTDCLIVSFFCIFSAQKRNKNKCKLNTKHLE